MGRKTSLHAGYFRRMVSGTLNKFTHPLKYSFIYWFFIGLIANGWLIDAVVWGSKKNFLSCCFCFFKMFLLLAVVSADTPCFYEAE